MKIDPNTLLQGLASAGQLLGVGPGAGSSAPSVEQASFADLLEQARDGTLATGQPVAIAPGAQVTLNKDQLARVSLAADRAEAQGLRTALVLIDGRQLLLDVHTRQITGTATNAAGVISGVDGVIDLGNSGAPGAAGSAPGAQVARPAGPLAPPALGLTDNASLARLLQDLQGG